MVSNCNDSTVSKLIFNGDLKLSKVIVLEQSGIISLDQNKPVLKHQSPCELQLWLSPITSIFGFLKSVLIKMSQGLHIDKCRLDFRH